MTAEELRNKYNEAYKIIKRERGMREHVFCGDSDKRGQKVAEMDRLLEIVTAFKDELKLSIGGDYEQPVLLDVPRKVKYG